MPPFLVSTKVTNGGYAVKNKLKLPVAFKELNIYMKEIFIKLGNF